MSNVLDDQEMLGSTPRGAMSHRSKCDMSLASWCAGLSDSPDEIVDQPLFQGLLANRQARAI